MKRRLLTILLLLLAGAVVNVGVAWGGWLLPPGSSLRVEAKELEPMARTEILR